MLNAVSQFATGKHVNQFVGFYFPLFFLPQTESSQAEEAIRSARRPRVPCTRTRMHGLPPPPQLSIFAHGQARVRRSLEVREHEFFKGIDWQLVYLRKYPPPLVPPRGEVNAADAFDIGSFDEEDTKYIKLTESDLEPYRNFPLVVSERWQLEIAETVFDVVNQETDRIENKRRTKQQQQQPQQHSTTTSQKGTSSSGSECSAGETSISVDPHSSQLNSDCIVEGDVMKLVGPFFQTWQRKFLQLFPNRLEMYSKSRDGAIVKKGVELIFMFDIREISPHFQRMYKMDNCFTITLKNDSKIVITSPDKILITQWKEEIEEAFQISNELISNLNKKAHKMYGADSPQAPSSPVAMTPRSLSKTASDSTPSHSLVRQTSIPSVGLQKSLTKLYSLTGGGGGSGSGNPDRSPVKSNVEPIPETDTETQVVRDCRKGDA
ncbi:unnamed protein product [Mesocestoides corti]|uniref:G protein-coupled receptor kinase n=1 Tax=Mesocestoides corti TaxID=53468 RepID=A0A0R3UE62_MESCO|nr:unnamed protein product [Mesocestoides corti]